MKIKKSNKNKKMLLGFLVVILLVASYTALAYTNHLWPFQKEDATTSSETKKTSSDRKRDSSNATDDKQSKTEDKSTTESSPSANESATDSSQGSTSQSDVGYINPPLLNPPSKDDPYPIENERYRIAQSGPTSFDVALYPIINGAEYSNYNAQLKAYKNEVLDYLEKRHGDTSKLSIQWRPSDAQNL